MILVAVIAPFELLYHPPRSWLAAIAGLLCAVLGIYLIEFLAAWLRRPLPPSQSRRGFDVVTRK